MTTPWNNSPKEIALAPSVNSFKSKLDLYLRDLSRNSRYLLAVSRYRRVWLPLLVINDHCNLFLLLLLRFEPGAKLQTNFTKIIHLLNTFIQFTGKLVSNLWYGDRIWLKSNSRLKAGFFGIFNLFLNDKKKWDLFVKISNFYSSYFLS